MKGSKVAHHLFIYILLVCMDCLGVLTKVVESGEMLSTVAVERALARVFSDSGKRELERVLGYEGRGKQYLICLARCSLRLKTIRQSP